VTYWGSWTGDVEATMSHIHQGGAAGTGNVVVPLTLTADAGGFSGTFPLVDLTNATNSDGGFYVNVHTVDAGNGLIRGQLVTH
jgi:CHRD domain